MVDPRTLAPLDEETILTSVGKTNKLVVVCEASPVCSFASEVAAIVAEKGFDLLDAPIQRVTSMHTPIPFAPKLEKYVTVSEEDHGGGQAGPRVGNGILPPGGHGEAHLDTR